MATPDLDPLLIRGGRLIDGTGRPARDADLLLRDGRIAEVGPGIEAPPRVLEAAGKVVAPGFIDPHTHYDAQICWDPLLTSSPWHGVTSVVMGNCGVGLAPCRPELREIATMDLVNVEAMSPEVLNAGLSWDWETFPEYIEAARRRGSAINTGFLLPLAPLRHYVMGEASMQRAANGAEIAGMQRHLREALEAGALGFSTTVLPQHIGYAGRPLACRNASREELGALARVLREMDRGVIEIALTRAFGRLTDDEYELLEYLLDESGRPITWTFMLAPNQDPQALLRSLEKAEPLIARGAIPQVSCRPFVTLLEPDRPAIFVDREAAKPLFNATRERQMELFADPAFRRAIREEMQQPGVFSGNWELMEVVELSHPELQHHVGHTVADIAEREGKDGLDAYLDLIVEDQLQSRFLFTVANAHEPTVAQLLGDERVILGLSDGGAHVDQLCDAGYPTYLLGHWVRERGAVSLERAVERMTAEPARLFGLGDRGTLEVGKRADVTIFDPDTVSSARLGEWAWDLPTGARRLVVPATGIDTTLVAGQLLFDRGEHTGALPGSVLEASS